MCFLYFQGRARRLYDSGYHTLKDIANAEPKELIKCVGHLSYRNAVQIISSAKVKKSFLPLILNVIG